MAGAIPVSLTVNGHRFATSETLWVAPHPTATTREAVGATTPVKVPVNPPLDPPTPIAGTAVHAVPSQCMATGSEKPNPVLTSPSLPTAHSPPPGTAVTSRRLLPAVLESGVGTTFQAEPFHSTATVPFPVGSPPCLLPTAHA